MQPISGFLQPAWRGVVLSRTYSIALVHDARRLSLQGQCHLPYVRLVIDTDSPFRLHLETPQPSLIDTVANHRYHLAPSTRPLDCA